MFWTLYALFEHETKKEHNIAWETVIFDVKVHTWPRTPCVGQKKAVFYGQKLWKKQTFFSFWIFSPRSKAIALKC